MGKEDNLSKNIDVRELINQVQINKGEYSGTFNVDKKLGMDARVNHDDTLDVSYLFGGIDPIPDKLNGPDFDHEIIEDLFNSEKTIITENELQPILQNDERNLISLTASHQERIPQIGPIKAKLIRDDKAINIEGGLDFSNAIFDEEMGKMCIVKKDTINTIERSPILECKHRQV